jgi:two-component system sensor histidine kinase DegS
MMDFDSPKDDLTAVVQKEMKQIKDKLFEIKGQIEQTQLLVDREQTRNADIATELRTIQDNLDSVPRQDIKSKYDEAIDARFRLTTMRGQLEKFQANREMLEQQQVLLNKVLTGIQGASSFDAINDIVAGGSSGAGRGPVPISIVRIVQSQEEEKMRLARLMHDGPAQSLTNFILQTEICQRLFDRDPARAAEELDNLKSTASVTFQKVRDFIFDLRPMMLDDLGVVPTVRRYVEAFKDKNDIETRLELLGEERRLESHREVMVFRGIQELMANARDYGQATQIFISLDISQDRVKIEVEDNGRGFDANSILEEEPAHLEPRAQSTLTLKERYELVGGSLQATSSETDGTQVKMELPARD